MGATRASKGCGARCPATRAVDTLMTIEEQLNLGLVAYIAGRILVFVLGLLILFAVIRAPIISAHRKING